MFDNDTLDCPEYTRTQEKSLSWLWISDVVAGVIAVLGLIANIVFALILGK